MTAHVWAFFAPTKALAKRVRQIVLSLQALVFLSIGSAFRANSHIFTPVPDPPAPAVAPSVPMQVRFAHNSDVIELLGWRAEGDSAGMQLYLYWPCPDACCELESQLHLHCSHRSFSSHV
ncbi:MAG: hypothetical protein D6749_07975 [Chloroflexota bacterium]|nr:MAG: hypothetical protein D6749_07975 [Chloroflexota bacterium]